MSFKRISTVVTVLTLMSFSSLAMAASIVKSTRWTVLAVSASESDYTVQSSNYFILNPGKGPAEVTLKLRSSTDGGELCTVSQTVVPLAQVTLHGCIAPEDGVIVYADITSDLPVVVSAFQNLSYSSGAFFVFPLQAFPGKR